MYTLDIKANYKIFFCYEEVKLLRGHPILYLKKSIGKGYLTTKIGGWGEEGG